MKGFEVEYFSEVGTGPRYRVDAETGEIARDDVFMHGEGPLTESNMPYPGEPDVLADAEAAEEAYEQILETGLEPGEFHKYEPVDDRAFRVEVYGPADEPDEVECVDTDLVNQATEDLDDLF
jgi:hypothetical protein